MEDRQQTTLAQQNDPSLGARIVERIAEIESDHRLAEGPISQRLLEEIEATMRKAAPQPWVVAQARYAASLSHPTWRPTKGLGYGDFWLEISEVASDSDDAHTWVGTAVGVGHTKFGLELMFRPALAHAADVVWREKGNNDLLAKIGVMRDAATGRLILPIKVDRLRLSKAWMENDLASALAPVANAVEVIVAAKAELDTLLEALRAKVKRK